MTHTGENTLFLVWSEKCNKYMSSWVRWRNRTEQNNANGHRVQCFFVLWVFTAAAVQQLLPSMSTLDTVVGGSFLVEACLPETGLQLVVVIQATFGSGSFFHIVGRGFLHIFLSISCFISPISSNQLVTSYFPAKYAKFIEEIFFRSLPGRKNFHRNVQEECGMISQICSYST